MDICGMMVEEPYYLWWVENLTVNPPQFSKFVSKNDRNTADRNWWQHPSQNLLLNPHPDAFKKVQFLLEAS
jgi:hypothetical protein